VTVDGIEVPRAGQTIRALHGESLRREPRAASGATPLQDQPPCARRHAGAKAVLPLPASDVGLVGALHDEKTFGTEKSPLGGGRRAASIDEARPPTCPQPPGTVECAREEFPPLLSTPVEGCGGVRKHLQMPAFCPSSARCYARHPGHTTEELAAGWSTKSS
jgi:hypothetical protein